MIRNTVKIPLLLSSDEINMIAEVVKAGVNHKFQKMVSF